jgi:hypothetical protein
LTQDCDEYYPEMDPITTAIIAALGKLAEPAVKDAYSGLKNLIFSKYKEAHPSLPHTVSELEKRPDSNGYRQVLAEEVAHARAAEDPELASAAQSLLQLALPKGPQIQNVRQDVRGNQNTFSGTGDVNIREG